MWIKTDDNTLLNLDSVSLFGTGETYSNYLPKYKIYALVQGFEDSVDIAYFNDDEEGRAKMKVLTDVIGKGNIIRFEKK